MYLFDFLQNKDVKFNREERKIYAKFAKLNN
jgi:hypothetical protein